jgi:hypothetical protein
MQHHDEHVKHLEGRRRHDEKVDGDEVGDVVLEKRSPSLRRWGLRPRSSFGKRQVTAIEAVQGALVLKGARASQRVPVSDFGAVRALCARLERR